MELAKESPLGTYFNYSLFEIEKEEFEIKTEGCRIGRFDYEIPKEIKHYFGDKIERLEQINEKIKVDFYGKGIILLKIRNNAKVKLTGDGTFAIIILGNLNDLELNIDILGSVWIKLNGSFKNIRLNLFKGNHKIELYTENCEKIDVRALSRKNEIKDVFVDVEEKKGECLVNMYGISFGELNLRGNIKVFENAGGELIIRIFNFARASGSPILQVYGKNVKKAKHSVIIEKIPKEIVVYLRSRGLNEEDIIKIFEKDLFA